MGEKERAFDQALSNFTFGIANRDLICHMAGEGYSVKQIKEAADYPVSVEKIAETVWEYYLETGVLRLTPPGEGDDSRYEYVMDIGKYGKRSFRRVEVSDNTGDKYSAMASLSNKNRESAYIPCSFGLVKARDPKKYREMLDVLDSRKRDYVDGLPWPAQVVYHIDNLAMREIQGILLEADMWE